ncbi:hypothetical protein LSAT2_030876 [Lamellibrachia satsuma]|nr:hypothetical protein LSAT2_030876 [Lamellibrachia satsuma]
MIDVIFQPPLRGQRIHQRDHSFLDERSSREAPVALLSRHTRRHTRAYTEAELCLGHAARRSSVGICRRLGSSARQKSISPTWVGAAMHNLQETTSRAETTEDGATDMNRAVLSGSLAGPWSHRKRAKCPAPWLAYRIRHITTAILVALCMTVILPFVCFSRFPDANNFRERHDE